MRHMEGNTRTDCFGYYEHEIGNTHGKVTIRRCTALNEMLCDRKECPFYMNADAHREKLMALHGTASLQEICTAYEQKKMEERREHDKQ